MTSLDTPVAGATDLQDERLTTPQGIGDSVRATIRRARDGDLGMLPVVAGIVVIWTIFQSLNSTFLSSTNLVNLAFDMVSLGVIALGIVCVLLVGQIDLSVGSVSGVAAATTGVVMVRHEQPMWLAILVAIGGGVLIGWLYGQVLNRFGVPSFVATLGGLLAFLGTQLWLLRGENAINLPYDSTLVKFAQVWFVPEALVLAPYDICATAIGSGAVSAGRACTILGTTLSTEIVTDSAAVAASAAYLATDQPVGITVTLGVPGHYLRAFPTMSGGDMLDWGARLLGLASVTELMSLAERGAGNAAGVRFLPYLSPAGERAPFFAPAARGSLSGLSLDSGREDVARAVVEGVTMAIRDCLAASPAAPDLLTLSGGGTRSGFWMRLIADVTGLPVAVPADAEIGARGAWLTGMVATGREPDFPTAAARQVRIAATYEPDPKSGRAVGDRYAEFLRLRELHHPIWALGRGSTDEAAAGGAGA